MIVMELKRCPRCGKTKSLSEFSSSKHTGDGLCCWCKECSNEISRNWRSTPSGIYSIIKGREKFFVDRKPFNITKEDFIEWYENEPKTCAYCDIPEDKVDIFRDKYNIHARLRLTVDCKDDSIGYKLGNIVLACGLCNTLKMNVLSFDEMRDVGQRHIKSKWSNPKQ